MEFKSGNIFIRSNPMRQGAVLDGHEHNFDHTTFFQSGWHMCRRVFSDGTQSITQHCSMDYRKIRVLLEKYEPDSIPRPVRGPDNISPKTGRPSFNVRFVGRAEAIPDGFDEIPFEPIHYHVLSAAEVEHEFIALSSDAELNCVYSHRNAQGEIVQDYSGFEPAYR